jgi:hypothetical protein
MLSSFQNKLVKNAFKQNKISNGINKSQINGLYKHRFFNRMSITREGVVVPGFKSFDEYIEYFNVNKQ